MLEPFYEMGTTPLKLFTAQALLVPFATKFETDTINWSIIPVSKILVLQIRLFRTVIAWCWQIFLDILNEGPKLQEAIQAKALWANESGMSLASH